MAEPVDDDLETNPVILVLAEIAVALETREQEARANLTVVEDEAA